MISLLFALEKYRKILGTKEGGKEGTRKRKEEKEEEGKVNLEAKLHPH